MRIIPRRTDRCSKGHILTADVLRVKKSGYQECRLCSSETAKRRRHRICPNPRSPGRMGLEYAHTLHAKISPTKADLAWAAGFLEGEACFTDCGGHSHRVEACNTDFESVERLLELFGGKVHVCTPAPRCKKTWRWGVYGARARGVMMTVYGFIRSARRKAAIRNVLSNSLKVAA